MSDATLANILKIVLDIQSRVTALEAGGGGGGGGAAAGGGPGGAEPAAISPAVVAYDEFITSSVKPLIETSKSLGAPEGEKIGALIEKAFLTYTRDFIYMASQNKKPQKAADLQPWKDELAALIKEVNAFKDNRSPFVNLMCALSEATQCVSWVFQNAPDLPAPFIENFLDGTLFYSNKVLVANKKLGDAGAKYVTWCTQFKDLLNNLIKYVKANHTTGVVFNPKGATTYTRSGAPAPSAGSAPAPAAAPAPVTAKADAGKAPAKADIFAGITSIDQSAGFTAGLKKVDKSEMTHKNAALRAGAVVKAAEPTKKETAAKPATLTCNNNRWEAQYQTEKVEINIESSKQEVYVFGCVGAVLIIKGKFKTLTIDSCKKTSVVLDSVISTVEVVNCKNQKVQVLGNAPAVAVDKCESFQLFLSKDSLTTQIVSSKSSDMNVNFEQADGEWKECPIPEQFVSKYEKGKLTTTVSDLYH